MDTTLLNCSKCGKDKPPSAFYNSKTSKTGKEGRCKQCLAERRKWLRENDPDYHDLERAAKRRYWEKKGRALDVEWEKRKRLEYIAEHGEPICQCGCGETGLSFTHGVPRKYKQGHINRVPEVLERRAKTFAKTHIPIEDFRKAWKKIREQRGYTNAQMAEISGMTFSQMNEIMYGKRKQFITKKLAERVLRRLAGMATEPTSMEKRLLEYSNRMSS